MILSLPDPASPFGGEATGRTWVCKGGGCVFMDFMEIQNSLG